MPRGRKPTPKSYEDQLAAVDAQIADYKELIDELKAQRKTIISAQNNADMEDLMSAVKASGRTPAELLAELRGLKSEPDDAE